MGWDARAVAVDGAGLRSGMTAAEMVARFARLNELATADALREFADPGSPAPTLRARMVSARLADESRLLGVVDRSRTPTRCSTAGCARTG